MNKADIQYLAVAQELRDHAIKTPNRTDTSAYKLFGKQLTFDLREGFPLLTTKKVHLTSIIHELLWFLKGDTNIQYLKDNKCRIWDEWATEDGDLGPVYGAQWRKWQDIKIPKSEKEYNILTEQLGYKEIGMFENKESNIYTPVVFRQIDQIADAINTLQANPADRRIIVTAYNPTVKPTTDLKPHENAEIELQALPPCHMLFQFNTTPISLEQRIELFVEQQSEKLVNDREWVEICANREGTPLEIAREDSKELWDELMSEDDAVPERVLTDGFDVPEYYLDMQMYQRSADWFLGVPFNIASYSLLQMMFAQQVNMVARNYVHTFGDYHIYENHLDVIDEQLKQEQFDLPSMVIRKAASIDEYTIDDFDLQNYKHGPVLKGKVAV